MPAAKRAQVSDPARASGRLCPTRWSRSRGRKPDRRAQGSAAPVAFESSLEVPPSRRLEAVSRHVWARARHHLLDQSTAGKYEREPAGSLSSQRCALLLIFPLLGFIEYSLQATVGRRGNKVAAGLNPAAPAALLKVLRSGYGRRELRTCSISFLTCWRSMNSR